LAKWLEWAGININIPCDDILSLKEKDYTLLKEHFENYIDINSFLQ
jgi:hypothetical protein